MTWLEVAHPFGAPAPVATTAQVIDAYTAGTVPAPLRELVEWMFLRAGLSAWASTRSPAPVAEAITAPELREAWEELLP